MKNNAIRQMMEAQHPTMSVIRVEMIEQVNGQYVFEVDMADCGIEDSHIDQITNYVVKVGVSTK